MKRFYSVVLVYFFLSSVSWGQETLPAPTQSSFASTPSTPAAPVVIQGQGEVMNSPVFPLTTPLQTPQLLEKEATEETSAIHRFYENELFHYTWIDFGNDPGLRIHRIEMTNAWADFRSSEFFHRSVDEPYRGFHSGLSFSVQWWKESPDRETLQPVFYDLYLDLGWRAALSPIWQVDLALSPGFSTDFRITPPEGFRMRGHAITMVDMLSNLRGVLGVWYLNRNTTKLLPVAGFAWQATDATRVEAIFPQPRIVHTIGCWRDNTWEFSVGGEFGGGGWAFKGYEDTRETIDYRDLRVLVGIARNGKKGQGILQVGYVFNRELTYGTQKNLDVEPGNAWMIRVGWDY